MFENRFGKIRDEENMLAVKKLIPESLPNYRFRRTTMSYSELVVALENIIVDKVATVPTARSRKHDTSAPMEIGMAAKEDGENASQEGNQRIIDLALQAVYKGTGKGKCGFGKGQNWNEKGGKGGKNGGKNSWQKSSGKKGGKGQEKGGKGETRTCWTCGKTGHIAAWCRKVSNNNLYAMDEDDSENVEESAEDEDDLQAWCLLEDSEHEQWHEVISRRSKQRAKKVNQASLLRVESSHSLSPKKIVEVKDKWVKVRVTTDSGAVGYVMPETMFPHVNFERRTSPKKFVAANGEQIKDLGEKSIPFKTNEGVQRCFTFRSANVVNPSFPCKKVVRAGNDVVLDEKNPYIRNTRDGTVIKLDVNNGVYTMDMWICLDETGPVFSWQGFDKPVRPAALCISETADKEEVGRNEEIELNGFEEERDDMSDEEGDKIDGEEELAAPDWRVRAGPRNKPTQREREEHEATHVPFRDWCAHSMMGRGRTHHHVAKQKSEDQSKRPIIAMEYFFMKLESAPSVQSISEEPITCVAVKEDRHQNIMSSVALKKGVDEPRTIERVVKFIDLLGYQVITLKSDTEPAIIAFRNRVAAMCKIEVTTEDAVKGDKESNGLIENAAMPLRGFIRTIKCHIESRTQEPLSDDSPVMPWLVEHAGCILSRCQKSRDGKTPFERMHGEKPTQEFVPFGEKSTGKTNHHRSEEQDEPQIYQYGVWRGMRNNSAECFIGNADGVFRAREIRRLEP